MKTFYKQGKRFALPMLLGFISFQAHALPNAPGIAHAPYHIKPNTNSLVPSGLSPAQVRKAYGFGDNNWTGRGQVIGIVDAFDDPNIESDLNVFSSTFGLAACTTANGCFEKVYATGKKPKKNAGWAGEISLDVEWVHAMAPNAKIMLVETANSSMNALMQGVKVAIQKGANVITMSWGGAEFSTETSFDSMFNVPGVTFTAASGDSGAGVIYPAASPNVIATGGTTLTLDSSGNYISEKAWSGSGGGVSAYETIPAYQKGLPIPNNPNNMRGIPDVSYNADPNSGSWKSSRILFIQ
jgi:subtilase family serine protease